MSPLSLPNDDTRPQAETYLRDHVYFYSLSPIVVPCHDRVRVFSDNPIGLFSTLLDSLLHPCMQ